MSQGLEHGPWDPRETQAESLGHHSLRFAPTLFLQELFPTLGELHSSSNFHQPGIHLLRGPCQQPPPHLPPSLLSFFALTRRSGCREKQDAALCDVKMYLYPRRQARGVDICGPINIWGSKCQAAEPLCPPHALLQVPLLSYQTAPAHRRFQGPAEPGLPCFLAPVPDLCPHQADPYLSCHIKNP